MISVRCVCDVVFACVRVRVCERESVCMCVHACLCEKETDLCPFQKREEGVCLPCAASVLWCLCVGERVCVCVCLCVCVREREREKDILLSPLDTQKVITIPVRRVCDVVCVGERQGEITCMCAGV